MKRVLALLILVGVVGTLKPWTIVPLHTAAPAVFDPVGYVATIWDAEVLPTAERSAVDLLAFINEPAAPTSGRAVFVRGTATIAEVDRASRVGLARLATPQAAGGRRAAIQIGPVLRGTAVRDALAFIRFTDFVNQLEFAAVAGALNDRVLRTVLEPAASLAAGREISFIGAVPTGAAGEVLEIVPLKLEIGGGTR